jgi:hypothetical protein
MYQNISLSSNIDLESKIFITNELSEEELVVGKIFKSDREWAKDSD